MDEGQQREEWLRCALSPLYFIVTYVWIEDKIRREWLRFRLWPEQIRTLKKLQSHKLVIILKARQLGLTWLLIALALWMMLFRPGTAVLLFSRRDDEAKELLERLRQMHLRLPRWMRAAVGTDNDHELEFPGLGSVAKAFPTTKHSGRSYTGTVAIVDEADLIPWLRQLLSAVKPTVDGGGWLWVLSTVDKEKPVSEFKRVWKRAVAGLNNYLPIFLPWWARPGRDAAWYEQQQADYTQDDLFQEYPATPAEALAPRASSKRFQPGHLDSCFDDSVDALSPTLAGVAPASPAFAGVTWPEVPGLVVYELPVEGGSYVVACDTAEGNPGSDPSPATVWDAGRWVEVAHLWGRFEPEALAGYLVQLAGWYNGAVVCVERNNHGHAVHVALRAIDSNVRLYCNPFDGKDGWLSSVKYKTLAVDSAATIFREAGCTIRTEATLLELVGIEAATLKAPEGETDDRAMTVIIGLAALRWPTAEERRETGPSAVVERADPLEEIDAADWR